MREFFVVLITTFFKPGGILQQFDKLIVVTIFCLPRVYKNGTLAGSHPQRNSCCLNVNLVREKNIIVHAGKFSGIGRLQLGYVGSVELSWKTWSCFPAKSSPSLPSSSAATVKQAGHFTSNRRCSLSRPSAQPQVSWHAVNRGREGESRSFFAPLLTNRNQRNRKDTCHNPWKAGNPDLESSKRFLVTSLFCQSHRLVNP